MTGKDYIAVRRLVLWDRTVIAEIGETCERVPASRHGGTVADALERLIASGKIAPAPVVPKPARRRAAESEGA